MKTKQVLLVTGSLAAIAFSAWFWLRHFNQPDINVALHQGIGHALADETIRCLNGKGDILVITLEEKDSEILATQFAAFREKLSSSSQVNIDDVEYISAEKSDKYSPGLGLSASKLAREVKKNTDMAAIVSFVGLPELEEKEFAELGEMVPPILTFSRDADKLGPLARRGFLKAAIVPRFRFPAPGPESPRTAQEWFVNQYQIIRSSPPPVRH